MSRNFGGGTDLLTCALGALTAYDNTDVAVTYAAVCRRNSTAWNSLVTMHESGGTPRWGMEIEDHSGGDRLWIYGDGGTFRQSTFTVLNADGWVFVACSQGEGTTTPRFHKYVYGTGAWTHENAAGTLRNVFASSNAGGSVRIGNASGDVMNGDIAIVGWWSRILTDAEVELLPHDFRYWYGSNPLAGWLLDQSLTTQLVTDFTGGGANQSALTGTTVSTTSPAMTYGHPVLLA